MANRQKEMKAVQEAKKKYGVNSQQYTDAVSAYRGAATGPKAAAKAKTGFLGQNMPTITSSDFKDPASMTNAQQQMNEYNAQLGNLYNRPNETNAFGQRTYTTDAQGRTVINDALSANQQAINAGREQADIGLGGIANTALGQAQQNLSQKYDISGAPAMPGQQGLESWRTSAEDAEYQNYLRRMQPEFSRAQENLKQEMANQGIPIGSKLYNQQLSELAQQQSDAMQQAQSAARQTFTGQMQTQQQMGQAAHQQYISDYEQQRYAPLNEANTALQGQRGVVSPQFQGMAQLGFQSPDVAGTGLTYRQQNIQKELGAASGGSGESSDSGYGGYADYLNMMNSGGNSGSTGTGQIIAGIGQGIGAGVIGAAAGKSAQKKTGFLY